MKTLILIRHGETQKKKDPNRSLTKKGEKQVLDLSLKLTKMISNKDIIILYTPTERASLTAKIIKEAFLNSSFNALSESAQVRLENIDSIKDIISQNEQNGIRPAKTYLELGNYISVESPGQFVRRIDDMIKGLPFKTIVLISHEASLEAYYYHQSTYNLVKKSFNRYFDYADFAIFNRKDEVKPT